MKIIEEKIKEAVKKNNRAVIAVDGRCASGKTTFCEYLKGKYNCNIVHMDHFFLPLSMRTAERLCEPGGNIHHERLFDEVISKLGTGKAFSYRPYSCKNKSFGDEIVISPDTFTVFEGAYACHPVLGNYYELSIFFDIDPEKQIERIISRNGKAEAEVFKSKWIVLEEKYFDAFGIKEKCDLVVQSIENE